MQYTNHILKRHWCTTRDLQVSFGCLPDTQVAFSRRDFYMHFIEFLLGRSQFSHKQCLMTLKLIYWSIYSRQSITIVCRPLYPDRSSCDEFSVQMWILFIISRTILCHDKPLSMCWTVFENNQSRIKKKNPRTNGLHLWMILFYNFENCFLCREYHTTVFSYNNEFNLQQKHTIQYDYYYTVYTHNV